jgi:hypothetical protein
VLITWLKKKWLRDEVSSSNLQPLESLWKEIWKIKGTSVVKTFLWHACNDTSPTNERLFKRHITQDPLCPIYGLETETIGHILWSCTSARDVWLECTSQIKKSTRDEIDFIFIMKKLFERLNADQMQLVAMVARLIWLRRNSMVFGDFLDLSSLLRQAQDQVEACIKASQCRTRRGEKPNTIPGVVWQKPHARCVKLNWDTALDKNVNPV